MAEHECSLANCDGTRLGHELARDFPEETQRLVDGLARLGNSEDRVIAANLQVEHYVCQMCPGDGFVVPADEIGASLMQQHLKTEHDEDGLMLEFRPCYECGTPVLVPLGRVGPSTCGDHS